MGLAYPGQVHKLRIRLTHQVALIGPGTKERYYFVFLRSLIFKWWSPRWRALERICTSNPTISMSRIRTNIWWLPQSLGYGHSARPKYSDILRSAKPSQLSLLSFPCTDLRGMCVDSHYRRCRAQITVRSAHTSPHCRSPLPEPITQHKIEY